MGWRKYNPNPEKMNTSDCTVRAICAVTGLTWDAAHAALCNLAREMHDMPSINRVWWALLEGIGFRIIRLPDLCPACYTVRDFAADHPHGKYVLWPPEHAVAVIDGDWWDTWDSGGAIPIYAFEEGIHGVHTKQLSDVSAAVSAGGANQDD